MLQATIIKQLHFERQFLGRCIKNLFVKGKWKTFYLSYSGSEVTVNLDLLQDLP